VHHGLGLFLGEGVALGDDLEVFAQNVGK
jgi:hypothetical protein